jgi:hypothetical protein
VKIQKPALSTAEPVAASIILQRIIDQAPPDHFTLGWLLTGLSKHSFGIVLLVLALVAIAPGIAIVAGVLLLIPGFEMILGRASPTFPGRLAAFPLSTKYLTAVVQRAIPTLQHLEKFIHPRWPTPHETTKRVVGLVVVVLSPTLVFLPIPLSGIIPATIISLVALAYLEEDGLLLLFGLAAALAVLVIESTVIWAMIYGANSLPRSHASSNVPPQSPIEERLARRSWATVWRAKPGLISIRVMTDYGASRHSRPFQRNSL